MSLHLHPILAEMDVGQVVFFLVVVAVGFINWLVNLWKQKREDAERSRHLPTQDEMEQHRQTLGEHGRHAPEALRPPPSMPVPPPQPAPAPAAPTGGGGSLKELFEELKRAAEEARRGGQPMEPEHRSQPHPPRSVPPPLAPAHRSVPPPLSPPTPGKPVPSPALAGSRAEGPTLAAKEDLGSHLEAARRAAAAYSGGQQQRRAPHPLTALLHTPDGYRQAFVLKEVLDTPKGLRKSPWEELP